MNLPDWLRRCRSLLVAKASSVLAIATGALALTGLIVGYFADITAVVAAIGLIGLTALPVLAVGIVVLQHEYKKPAAQRRRRNTAGGCVLVVLALAAVVPRVWTVVSQSPAQAAAPTAKTAPPTKAVRYGLPGPNFDVDFEASEFHGWQKEIDTSPSVAIQLVADYYNTGSVQQDNVTLRFELPPELVYQPGTTRLGNFYHPDGIQTNDITAGMNVGSYAPGANAWILFSATLKDENSFLCDTKTLVPGVRVETDNGTKSAEVTIRVKRRC